MKKLQRSLQIKILLSCFLPIIFLGENLTLKEIFDSYTKFFFFFDSRSAEWLKTKQIGVEVERASSLKVKLEPFQAKARSHWSKKFCWYETKLTPPKFLSFSSGLVIVNVSVGLVAKQANQTSLKEGGIISQLLNLLLSQLLKGL